VQELLFAPKRASEELYDLASDPNEIKNLAADPAYQSTLVEMRDRLAKWIKETGDKGEQPESAAMYDSDMAEYLGGRGKGKPDAETARNIELMKKWAAEGK
jgi:hypothetical protein